MAYRVQSDAHVEFGLDDAGFGFCASPPVTSQPSVSTSPAVFGSRRNLNLLTSFLSLHTMDDVNTCSFCNQKLDTADPWHLLMFTLGQLDIGIGEGCKTCTLRKAAVSCFTSDPGAKAVFQQNPNRFRLNRQFYEIFKTDTSTS